MSTRRVLLTQQLATIAIMLSLVMSFHQNLIKITMLGLVLWYLLILMSNICALYGAGCMSSPGFGFLPESRIVLYFCDVLTKMSQYQYGLYVVCMYKIYSGHSILLSSPLTMGHHPVNRPIAVASIIQHDGGSPLTTTTSSGQAGEELDLDLDLKLDIKSEGQERQNNMFHDHHPADDSGHYSMSDILFQALQGPVILHSFWCQVSTMIVSDLVNSGSYSERPLVYIFVLDHVFHYGLAVADVVMSFYFGNVFGLLGASMMIYNVHMNPLILQEFGVPSASLRKYLLGMRLAQISQAAALLHTFNR